ncbi:MAG: ABC transporter permease subunit [Planctomycetes bacterium]|nr:ABC transporter permease subunit [Planctomycetota bacterium]
MSGLFALLRFEWTKLRGRRITWVPFAVLGAVVAVIVAVFHRLEFQHMLHLLRASFQLTGKQDFMNGYYMTAHAMNPIFNALLPIFIAVASGLMVAGETEQGTLRACLIRPVTRRALILGKFALLSVYALALCFFVLALLVGGGILSFGHGPLYTLNILFQNGQEGASMIPAAEVPGRMFLAGLIATFGMTVLAALALLISALVDTAAMAYVLTLSLYFAVLTLRSLPLLDWLYPYLFVTHMLRWQQCFYSHLPMGQILVSLVHLACYLVVFLSAAVLLFEERDIKT